MTAIFITGKALKTGRGSFDLVRLLAALAVMWSHQYTFIGSPEPVPLGLHPSEIGVLAFFALSGYLNTRSLITKPNSLDFVVRRARRIFPALLAFALFCVALGATVTTDTPALLAKAGDFIWRNTAVLFGLRYELPGVFEANHFPRAMNGSLWTLPIEVKLYIYLAIIAAATRYNPRFLLAALLVALGAFLALNATAAEVGQFNRLAAIFICGATIATVERTASIHIATGVLALITVAALSHGFELAKLPFIALLVVLVGKIEWPAVAPPIDISYGIYLYAFPVQQLFATTGMTFWASLTISLMVTTTLATLSAILVEQPALRFNFRRTAKVDGI